MRRIEQQEQIRHKRLELMRPMLAQFPHSCLFGICKAASLASPCKNSCTKIFRRIGSESSKRANFLQEKAKAQLIVYLLTSILTHCCGKFAFLNRIGFESLMPMVIEWSKWKACEYPELRLLFHIPNGGCRTRTEGAILSAMGVKKGIPDLFLPCAAGEWHGLFIEMKTADGQMSGCQCEMFSALRAAGYAGEVCRSADEAISVLEAYLKKRGQIPKRLGKGEKA